jgi:hypothetical protein
MNLQRRSRKKPPARTWCRFLAHLTRGMFIVSIVFCLVQVLVPRTAAGQDESVDEYKLKAAMLYNLTNFVEWPDSAYPDRQAPIVLCILGQDPFATSLVSTIPKGTDSGRPLVMRHLQSDKESRGCHILYISSSERKSAAHIFSTLNGSSTLTVGEMTQFAVRGGIIQFSMEDQHVRFDINLDAASRAGLRISSKLLAMAQIVNN